MSEAIHILLVDDAASNSPFVGAFKTRARDFGFKVSHIERGKPAIELLRSNPTKYKGVIIDARCIWDDREQFSNDKFLAHMITELERLESELNIKFPVAVNTAYAENFASERQLMVSRGGDIFLKSGSWDEDGKLFNFLKYKIENSFEWIYADIFELFDIGALDEPLRNELTKILKKSDDKVDIKDNFNPLRKILEAIYLKIRILEPQLIPDDVFIGRGGVGINLRWTTRYLSGLEVSNPSLNQSYRLQGGRVFPEHIESCVKIVGELSSQISHVTQDKVNIYAYRSAMFALLEILRWYRDFWKTSMATSSAGS